MNALLLFTISKKYYRILKIYLIILRYSSYIFLISRNYYFSNNSFKNLIFKIFGQKKEIIYAYKYKISKSSSKLSVFSPIIYAFLKLFLSIYLLNNQNKKITSMSEKQLISPMTFSKKLKHVCRKPSMAQNPKSPCSKNRSGKKSISSKKSIKSKSKQKNSFPVGSIKSQRVLDQNHNKNGRNAKFDQNNEEQKHAQHCWSIETSVETKILGFANDDTIQKRTLQKETSLVVKESDQKKDRKFSQNIHDILNKYQTVRIHHLKQKQLIGQDLNQKEKHRLNKIYAVEEAEFMIRVLHPGVAEKK